MKPAVFRPIWNELKATGICAVAMHPRLHSRLVRQLAVTKDRDLGYKILLSNEGKKAILTKKIEGSRVIFRLAYYYLNGLPVIDLSSL